MKHFYILLVTILVSSFGFGQPWTEDFNSQTSNSYATGSITINSRVWTRSDAGNFSYANTNMGSYAFTINDDKSGAHITTPSLNTCGTVSFDYAYINGSDTNVFQLQASTDGTNFTTIDTHTLGASSNLTYVNYSFDVNNSSSSTYIRILSDNQNAHLFIDDFEITAFSGSTETVDFCNLQWPGSATITQGSTADVFAQIYENGVVTNTELPGQASDIEAWIGVSATDATIVADFTSGDWTWVPMSFKEEVGNNDEYEAAIGASLTPDTYYYVSRFSVDGGPFAYGGSDVTDGDGGNFWDGTDFITGVLTVEAQLPTTTATFNINGCDDSDSYSAAYDASTQGIIWVELIYDGGCTELTIDTETSDVDTEIGIYDANGTLIGTNDDDTGGIIPQSLFTQLGLASGTYYIAAGVFDVSYGSFFNVTTSDTSTTGTIVINASTPNTVDFCNLQFPGSATVAAGSTATVYAQIYEAGNTPGAGAGTNITAEIGISSVDATTTSDFTSGDWSWTTAPYLGEVGDNDEYSLDIGASLLPGTYYYVSRFSVDGGSFAYGGNDISDGSGGDFWNGTSYVSGVLTVNPKPEPTNHALAFTATEDSSSEITLTWNDNDGAQVADGFLIVGKTNASSLFSPVDGTDPSEDTDWSDDEFEVKVASGVQTYTVTGLSGSTQYDFRIYPYTNSDGIIDFKTDGTIPEDNATTLVVPSCNSFFSDNFESDLTKWSNTNDWTINGGELKHDLSSQSGSSYIYSDIGNIDLNSGDYEWDFCIRNGNWDPSGSNRFSFFIISDDTNLLFEPTGYAVGVNQIGTSDDLELYSVNNGEYNAIITTAFDWNTNDDVCIKVTRNSSGDWELFYNANGGGETSGGTTTDSDFTTGDFIGSTFDFTSSRAGLFYIDDINICLVGGPIYYTFDSGTWSPSNPIGLVAPNDNIIISSGNAVISSNTEINTATVNAGAGLTIESTLTGDVTLESTSASYSSLILNGSISGTVNYERFVDSDANGRDLIAPPVYGQAFNDFYTANSSDLVTSGSNVLFGPFDNAANPGVYVSYLNSETATLDKGIGYRTASSSGSTLTFTGTVETGDLTGGSAIPITDETGNYGSWNLIGNPYPSYLNFEDFYKLIIDFDNGNANNQLDGSYSGVYGYDSDDSGVDSSIWTIWDLNNTTATDLIAPGQGFFVKAKSGGGATEFTTSMRRTGSSDDFIANRIDTNVALAKLVLTNGTNSYSTNIYFREGNTLGLDPGYDTGAYGGSANGIFTNLVEDNIGVEMANQSVPYTAMNDVVVPLGINANQGVQISIGLNNASTLPASINVYLEDTRTNTWTLLNDGDYTFTPAVDLNGVGYFFVHFSSSILSVDDNALNGLQILADQSSKTIVVKGLLQDATSITVYDILGREVLQQVLDSSNTTNSIDTSNLNTGLYVVKLDNKVQDKTQKLIIR